VIQKKISDQAPLLLVLARRADSLCSVIPSWAMAHSWGDLVLCHCTYDLLTRLADVQPGQASILIARPVMFTEAFITTALRICPSLRLIAWTTIEQTATDCKSFIDVNLPLATVSSTDELTNLINALEPASADQFESVTTTQAVAGFDPKDYKLSHDEISALLGSDQ
jgi:hypothetical protein